MAFIYLLSDPRNGHPRYVGKAANMEGRLRRHLDEAVRRNRQDRRNRWLRKLLALGLKPMMVELETCDDSAWQEREKAWIAHYRRLGHDLVNETDGGQGGVNPSPEVRAKIAAAMTGNRWSLGLKRSAETLRRMSEAHRGQQLTPEQRARFLAATAARRGIRMSEEHRRKTSDALRRRIRTKETGAKISASLRGNKNALGAIRSPLTCALISISKRSAKIRRQASELLEVVGA